MKIGFLGDVQVLNVPNVPNVQDSIDTGEDIDPDTVNSLTIGPTENLQIWHIVKKLNKKASTK